MRRGDKAGGWGRGGAATVEASAPDACLLAAADLGRVSLRPGHPDRAADSVWEKKCC